jgi:hypothetical protein
MKMKRVISVVLFSLFASFFQGMPAANAAAPSGVGGSISCSSSGANRTSTVNFNIGSNGGSEITSWEISFDDVNFGTIPGGVKGNSGSYSVTSWYSTSFSPYIRARNADGVSLSRNLGSSCANGGASSAPTVVSPANAPTGNAGSGQVLTSPLMFNSQPVGITSTYQWQRCTTSDTTSCADITGATSATYTAGADDVGKYLRTVVHCLVLLQLLHLRYSPQNLVTASGLSVHQAINLST